MEQLSKGKIVLFHLYPGIIITAGFILLGPLAVRMGFPPQAGMLIAILLFGLPAFFIHLHNARKKEHKHSLKELNGLTNKLSFLKLILYTVMLAVIAFIIWGATQPVNKFITDKLLFWLPGWYTVQDFTGYSSQSIKTTLILNLLLNGILAPVAEELYFRGYLLSRMEVFGKRAFLINTVLFSLYHFWQPYVYFTLLIALLPMIFLVWKTKSLQLAIWTHCALNCVGALLSFGLLMK